MSRIYKSKQYMHDQKCMSCVMFLVSCGLKPLRVTLGHPQGFGLIKQVWMQKYVIAMCNVDEAAFGSM